MHFCTFFQKDQTLLYENKEESERNWIPLRNTHLPCHQNHVQSVHRSDHEHLTYAITILTYQIISGQFLIPITGEESLNAQLPVRI